MEYILIGCVLGIVLCLVVLYRMTFGSRAAGKLEITSTEINPDLISASEYKEPGSFWSATKPVVTVRDIPFTRAEREEARAAAELAKATELQNVPDSETETVIAEVPKPKFDYPNFEGFPCDGESYDEFTSSMMTHGFVIRFIMASHEVQVIYTPPKSRNPMDALRRFYSPPKDIFPVNLLHDEGRMRTALWAMRHFKKNERPPELETFTYL
jgi:hypothetical protein